MLIEMLPCNTTLPDQYKTTPFLYFLTINIFEGYQVHERAGGLFDRFINAIPSFIIIPGFKYLFSPGVPYLEIIIAHRRRNEWLEIIVQIISIGRECIGHLNIDAVDKIDSNGILAIAAVPVAYAKAVFVRP